MARRPHAAVGSNGPAPKRVPAVCRMCNTYCTRGVFAHRALTACITFVHHHSGECHLVKTPLAAHTPLHDTTPHHNTPHHTTRNHTTPHHTTPHPVYSAPQPMGRVLGAKARTTRLGRCPSGSVLTVAGARTPKCQAPSPGSPQRLQPAASALGMVSNPSRGRLTQPPAWSILWSLRPGYGRSLTTGGLS